MGGHGGERARRLSPARAVWIIPITRATVRDSCVSAAVLVAAVCSGALVVVASGGGPSDRSAADLGHSQAPSMSYVGANARDMFWRWDQQPQPSRLPSRPMDRAQYVRIRGGVILADSGVVVTRSGDLHRQTSYVRGAASWRAIATHRSSGCRQLRDN